MLRYLSISHYALIEHLHIEWGEGLSVITGETGAGKSIMLGALNLLLGGRADVKAIQTGCKKCVVEASFDLSGTDLKPFFEENDIDYDATECIVRREVTDAGKSRAFINDVPVSASKLKEIGDALIDIHSQHQNLLIRDEQFLTHILDTIASNAGVLTQYKEVHAEVKEAEDKLAQLREHALQGSKDQDYLQFQLSQIEEAALTDGEQEELEQEQKLLAHAEEIKQALYQAQSLLNNDEVSVSRNLRQAADSLSAITEHFAGASSLTERLQSVRIELDDIEAEIESASSQIDYDPARLEYVESRLNTIYELEQKHRVTSVAEILNIAAELRARLNAIENVDEDIRLAEKAVEELRGKRQQQAAKLTATRQKAAHVIEKELVASLQNLGMPSVKTEFQVTPRTDFCATGADNVEMMFSANKNVPMQNIAQTASGGEIARLMLALKAIIAQRVKLPTIVFDEIDTGVSGTMADRMGQMMRQMSSACQVICITHLPQIAALGANHLRVFKEETDNSTHTQITVLNAEERIEEIARMLSGSTLTDAALENARSLLSTSGTN